MQTRRGVRRTQMRAKLGRGAGARSYYRSKGQPAYGPPYRSFVPRTMGPFSVTESKYFDSFLSAYTLLESTNLGSTTTDPATLNTLFVPSEGSDIDNRIGRKVSVYKIAIRGVLSIDTLVDAADVIQSPSHRILVWQDMQTNGTQSTTDLVFQPATTTTVPLSFCSFQNLSNLGRFRVLRDLTLRGRDSTAVTDGTNTSSQGIADVPFKITIRFRKPVIVKFNSTNGGSVADIVDNSFHMGVIKSSSDYETVLHYQCRTYYKDA